MNEDKYKQTLERIFSKLQAFHRVGASAYKPGLQNVKALSNVFGNPHQKFRTIHVGGTNGKGSTAHLLAAVLSAAGYKTGLYTSPHLVDYAERIRIDGKPILHSEVIDFVERFESIDCELDPSFFELATIMAFEHFARHNVDIAVVEVGLGGRLDATNIIIPELAIVTNVSLDHTSILGKTKEEIAREKAGIFKSGIPAIVGEADDNLREVFSRYAFECGAELTFVQDCKIYDSIVDNGEYIKYINTEWGNVSCCLLGSCQPKNAATVMCALSFLKQCGYSISDDAVKVGFSKVCQNTGLMARWMKIRDKPMVICDTGHNVGAWQYLGAKLDEVSRSKKLAMVVGFVNDKDYASIMHLMPRSAKYFVVAPAIERAADTIDVLNKARECGLDVDFGGTVIEGYKKALAKVGEDGMVFVGGSTFVVADLLEFIVWQ